MMIEKESLNQALFREVKESQTSVEKVRALIDAGADVNAATEKGSTALMFAVYKGHVEIVKLLLAAKADVNAANKDGATALMWATLDRSVEWDCSVGIAKLLLEAGADVNYADESGWTALMAAVYDGHTDIVELLLKAGADINAANKDGKTALMWAARDGHLGIAKLLLEAGADVDARNRAGYSALNYASARSYVNESFGNQDMIILLKAKGRGSMGKKVQWFKYCSPACFLYRPIKRLVARYPSSKEYLLPHPATIAACVLLLIGCAKMPHGYYTFLRVAICAYTILAAVQHYRKNTLNLRPLLAVGIAILYNPAFPVGLYRGDWIPVNILSALLIYLFLRLKLPTKTASGDA